MGRINSRENKQVKNIFFPGQFDIEKPVSRPTRARLTRPQLPNSPSDCHHFSPPPNSTSPPPPWVRASFCQLLFVSPAILPVFDGFVARRRLQVRIGAMEEEVAGPDEAHAVAGDCAPSRLRGKPGLDYPSDPTLPRVLDATIVIRLYFLLCAAASPYSSV